MADSTIARPARLLAGLLAAGCLACADDRQMPGTCSVAMRPARAVLVDSVVLEESDSAFLGQPAAMVYGDAAGRTFVGDHAANQVLAFARSGKMIGVVGRPGAGPGEFRGIGAFGHSDGEVLLHDDNALKRLNVFDARTLNFKGAIKYTGYLAWIARDSSRFQFALVGDGFTTTALPASTVHELSDGAGVKPMREFLERKVAEYGTIEPGKRADLLLLRADPSTDIRNIRQLEWVMRDGVVIDPRTLPTKPIYSRSTP